MSKTHKRSKSTDKNQGRPQLGGKKRLTCLSWLKILRKKMLGLGSWMVDLGMVTWRKTGSEEKKYTSREVRNTCISVMLSIFKNYTLFQNLSNVQHSIAFSQ